MATNETPAVTRVRRAPSLADEVARLIGDDIAEGRFKPGDRLPTEQRMCETYGVSRAVVREAISRLKSERLLESFQGRGVFVSEHADVAPFRMATPDLADKREIRHVLELMLALEGQAAALAARRRTRRDLATIRRRLEAVAGAIERGDDGVAEDLAFHLEIGRVTHNPVYSALLGYMEKRIRHVIRSARAASARIEGLPQRVQVEHEAIFAAIEAGDPDAARNAAETHLRNAADRISLYRAGSGTADG